MGRSAKLMKRPTKAEKVSRTVNAPPPSRRQQRSLSPDNDDQPRSTIPLFNTSVPGRPGAPPLKRAGRLAKLADYDPTSLDTSAATSPVADKMEAEADEITDGGAGGPAALLPKKKTARERLLAAKEAVAVDEHRARNKLQGKPKSKGGDKFSLGVDYVGLHEKRNGGKFAKKLR